MKVTLLGTGGPRPDPRRQGPATLIQVGEENLLFNAGRGVATQIVRAGVEITDLGGELQLANALITGLEGDLDEADTQLSDLEDDLGEANTQITSLESQLASAQSENADLESRVASSLSYTMSIAIAAVFAIVAGAVGYLVAKRT
jgi:chromosome segregation ATPase